MDYSVKKSVHAEDSNEEAEVEEYSNRPIVKSVSETASVEMPSQFVQIQDTMQQTLL